MKIIDFNTYSEIKKLQKDFINSAATAANLKVELEVVNKVYGSASWESYAGLPLKIVGEKVIHDIVPLQKGYFRSLIEKKKEENSSLKEMNQALSDTVKGLWSMIDLLQARKSQLEQDIKFMENYMRRGSEMIEKYVEDEK